MTALDLFQYKGENIRVTIVDDEPWFVASDVSRVLEYRMASDMTRRLNDEDKGYALLSTPGGDQQMTIINESGLYDAVFRSNADGARGFRRWVTHDVLPAIRKTGSYNAPAAISFEEMTAHVIAGLQERIAEAQARAKELESPAAAWESLSKAEGDFTVSDAAKTLARDGIATGPRKLYDWLDAEGWIFRRGGRWQAMQTAVNAGLLVERVTSGYFDQNTGERKQADPQVRVTPKGLQRIRDLLADQRTLAVVEGGAS